VTNRPVRPRPMVTAWAVDPLASYSYLIRARMNTS